jgi:hypothetical protein
MACRLKETVIQSLNAGNAQQNPWALTKSYHIETPASPVVTTQIGFSEGRVVITMQGSRRQIEMILFPSISTVTLMPLERQNSS